MISTANRRIGIPLVLLAGIFWSTSGILYRLIQEATPWHVLLYRSVALLLALSLWLGFRYRSQLRITLSRAGIPALAGGLCLGTAFAGYILALEYTMVANAMFLLASAPFFSALAGRILLGERIALYMWAAMAIAAMGIGIMAGEELSLGKGLGEGFALLAAVGFAGLTISLRIRPGTDKLITIFVAVIVATIYGLVGLILSGWHFTVPWVDFLNCLCMGWFQIGLGFALFTAGAKHLQAVEMTLLSMTEVIAGPIIVWVGIGEIPSGASLIGGTLILAAITLMALMGARASGRTPPFEAPVS
jgi:drug/metabolite transporter (DMT)-like permease|tara:strand:+ start:968 stop:1876 length:909 start_codon:yes stop_codon:yes gene_type:complete